MTNRKRVTNLDYSTDTILNDEFLLLIIAMIIGSFLIIALFINFYLPFKEERDYIKLEISRSNDKERKYWKRILREFYISHIPIIGRIILKIYRK